MTIAIPACSMPLINAAAIMIFLLPGNMYNSYSLFIQESFLCNHPHAMAKTPTKETYSAPLINIAVLMMFLLPGNFYESDALGRVYSAYSKHGPCRSNSFQPLDRNPLEYWVSLQSPAKTREDSRT